MWLTAPDLQLSGEAGRDMYIRQTREGLHSLVKSFWNSDFKPTNWKLDAPEQPIKPSPIITDPELTSTDTAASQQSLPGKPGVTP